MVKLLLDRKERNHLGDTSALMAEDLIGVVIMLISSADTGVRNADENLVRADLAGTGRLDDPALFGALEDGEGNHICRLARDI
jgi:hypothetical protein